MVAAAGLEDHPGVCHSAMAYPIERSTMPRLDGIPEDLYAAFSTAGAAASTAWRIQSVVDVVSIESEDGSLSIGPEAASTITAEAEQLLRQSSAAWRAFHTVETELMAVAQDTCAHQEACDFAFSIAGRFFGCRDEDGAVVVEEIQRRWNAIANSLKQNPTLDLNRLLNRIRVEAGKAHDLRRVGTPEAPPEAVVPLEFIPPTTVVFDGREETVQRIPWLLLRFMAIRKSAEESELTAVWSDTPNDSKLKSATNRANEVLAKLKCRNTLSRNRGHIFWNSLE